MVSCQWLRWVIPGFLTIQDPRLNRARMAMGWGHVQHHLGVEGATTKLWAILSIDYSPILVP